MLRVSIPLYDLYPNVAIYEKYGNYNDLYEGELNEEKLIALEEFKKDENGFLLFETDINSKDFTSLIDGFEGYKKEEIFSDYDSWKKEYSNILASGNKTGVAVFKTCYSMTRGIFDILFYIACDKNAPEDELQDIYKAISKAFDYEYEVQLPDKLEESIKYIKSQYKDVDCYFEDRDVTFDNNF